MAQPECYSFLLLPPGSPCRRLTALSRPRLRTGPVQPPHLGPEGIGDLLRVVATLALWVAYHPNIF